MFRWWTKWRLRRKFERGEISIANWLFLEELWAAEKLYRNNGRPKDA